MTVIPVEILLQASTIDQISGVLVSPNGEYTPEQVAALSPDAAVLYDWVMDHMDLLVEHCLLSEASGYLVETHLLRQWAVWYGLQDMGRLVWYETDERRATLTALKNWLWCSDPERRMEAAKTLTLCRSELQDSRAPMPGDDGPDDYMTLGTDRRNQTHAEMAHEQAQWDAYRSREKVKNTLMSLVQVAVDPHMDEHMQDVIRHTGGVPLTARNRFGLLCLLQPFLPPAPRIVS